MSLRGAETSAKTGGSEPERRKSRARVSFETAVTASDADGASAFEAESINVSPEGMRLRTAYLPEIGERLLCRFDGASGEVAVEGEVVWRNEESRGGEIGIQFTALDSATEEAVRALCKELDEPEMQDDKAPSLPRGARVRLHIDGLASPMKARVRDGSDKETLVGSNLEFLKVGRSLSLEDVEQGERREAFVDHVKVEVDAASGVPQLVVALRYDALPAPKPVSASSKAAEGPSVRAVVARSAQAALDAPKPKIDSRAAEHEIDEDSSLDAAAVSDEPGDVEGVDKRGLAKVGESCATAGRKVAGSVGPALKGIGEGAKGAMSKLFAAVRKRREERAEQDKKDAPRRMTAPPPGGALKSDGKRLVREEMEDDESLTPPPVKTNKKAALLGSALGLIAVLAVFGVTRLIAMRHSKTPAEQVEAAAAVLEAAAPQLPASPDGAPVGTADVPLFGATPMSTTETVPAEPPNGEAAGADAEGAEGAEANADGPGGEDEEANAASEGTKEWGEGNVRSPIKLRIKMDGEIEGFNGAKGAMGFTIVLPGRRILSSASELKKKDKRIATFQVVNKPNAAEITVQFKDGVPAYLARAKDNKLEILLGTDRKSKKSVAKSSKKSKKKSTKPKATAKKGTTKKSKKSSK